MPLVRHGHGGRGAAGRECRLSAATRDEVVAAGATYLAPAKAATVILGDASLIESSLGTLSTVERLTSAPSPDASVETSGA